MGTKNFISELKLEKLVFDELQFHRTGLVSGTSMEFRIGISISAEDDGKLYRVILSLTGDKKDEYTIKIVLSGFFSFKIDGALSDEQKEDILTQNAVTILMPYIRSELSLLTAQPNTECVVLPPLNIVRMLSSKEQHSESK